MYSKHCRILIVGEPGVGKSEFIEKCIQHHSTDYDVENNWIDALFGYQTDMGSLFEAKENKKISSQFIEFMIQFSHMFEKKTNIFGIPEETNLPCVQFFESGCCDLFDYDSGELKPFILDNFDKVIVMVDYTCINSMRSAFIWIDKMGLTSKNTIICVSKCDLEVGKSEARFERKAKVLETFSVLCPIECISSATGFNMDFFYKYI